MSITRNAISLKLPSASANLRNMPDGMGKSVWLSSCLVCVLELAELAPAGVLLCLCRIGIFFPFQPETEPIHIAVLRSHPLQRLLQDMLAIGEINHVNDFLLCDQGSIDFPFQ